MKRSLIILSICMLLSALVAGCHEPTEPNGGGDDPGDGSDGTDGGDELQATLTVVDPPAFVNAGESFNLTVQVEANQQVTTDHAGAHFSYNESSEDADPSQYTTILTETSPHGNATVPGEYTIVNWTISEDRAGETVYFRAHITLNGQSFWSDEHSFIVNPLS